MNSLVEKVAAMLPILEDRGTVYLFALAEREDIVGWDVVLSSVWSDEDTMEIIRFVVDLLKSRLEPRELTSISRIAVVPSDNPTMQALPAELDGVVPADNKVIYASLLGSDIRRAFIFKAQHPPTATSAGSPVGASVAAHA